MLFSDYNFESVNEGGEIWDDLEDGEIINLSNIRSKRACNLCSNDDEIWKTRVRNHCDDWIYDASP